LGVDIDGKQIRAARALLGWTIRDLAKASLVSDSTILRWEMGKATPGELQRTAIERALELAKVVLIDGGVVRR
jgi:ribosome-binding protein aMBF1 (putative translation factor)